MHFRGSDIINKRYGIIYCATNLVNNKKYIGQTVNSLHTRILQHISDAKYQDTYFHRALFKYGLDNFEWVILDTAINQNELNQKEVYWIAYYNTYKDKTRGYNITPGGSGKESTTYVVKHHGVYSLHRDFLVFDKIGNYIKTTNSNIIEFAQEIHASRTNVYRVLNNTKNSIKAYILIYKDEYTDEKLQERVNQTRDTRNFAVYDIHAQKWLGIWNNQTRCHEDTGFSTRMIQKQFDRNIKRPRKFIVKYLSNCSEEEIERINENINIA